MLMSEIQTEKKFQAKIPIAIWDEWEHWLDGRGSLNNTQIFCGLLRLFLASPESLQLKALFGRADELQVAESPAGDALSPEECEWIRQMFRSQATADQALPPKALADAVESHRPEPHSTRSATGKRATGGGRGA